MRSGAAAGGQAIGGFQRWAFATAKPGHELVNGSQRGLSVVSRYYTNTECGIALLRSLARGVFPEVCVVRCGSAHRHPAASFAGPFFTPA